MSDVAGLELFPAVDVAGGRAVGLVQAQYSSASTYGDPIELALGWQEQGARWLHLVDIDAAFSRGHNANLLRSVIEALDIPVQLSGGIRDADSLDRAIATGCARANLGTESLVDWAWVESAIANHGDRIAVCLDVEGDRLSPRGHEMRLGEVWDALDRLDELGCARYIVTDVSRDGAMTGPNLDLLRQVCSRTTSSVIASGGVSSLDDIAALRPLVPAGLEGTIIGKALYSGIIDLPHALAAAR